MHDEDAGRDGAAEENPSFGCAVWGFDGIIHHLALRWQSIMEEDGNKM
jgi:hypothetical protein